MLNGLNLVNQRILNVGDPTAATDAANKQYVDGVARGLDWKPEVVAASTGNVSLTAPGSTLDGVTLTAGMQTVPGIGTVTRVLLKDQTTPAENGIYDWTGASSALTRSVDADSGAELSGATVTVQRGTVNADRVYRVTTDDPLTLGTTPIALAQVGGASSAYTGGNGLTLTGSTFDVGAGTGITVGADTVGIDTSVVVRKVAANVGNGALTSVPIAHNLGTRDVTVAVYDSTTFEEVFPDVIHTDTNTVTLVFASAPATAAYRCVVHG
jgi:hypothetical protein